MKKCDVVGGLLKRINNYEVDNWDHRVAVQKIIYILQSVLNEDLGYDFIWYCHGPYSSSLNSDFYEIKNTIDIPVVRYKDNSIDQKYERFVNLIKNYSINPDVLELTASLFYFIKVFKDENLIRQLKIKKPYFKKEQYQEAIKLYHNILGLEKLN